MRTIELNRRHRNALAILLATALLVTFTLPALAHDDADRWDLSELYASKQAWEDARNELSKKIEALQPYKGQLTKSAIKLREALDLNSELSKEARRLWSYASMTSDLDTREAGPMGMKQALQAQFAELGTKTSWIDPEIVAIPKKTLDTFFKQDKKLAVHARYIERLLKQKEHLLDTKSEELLAQTALLIGDGNTIGTILRNAEIPWKTITTADGKQVRIDVSGYTKVRASTNRIDRIKAYDAFFSSLKAFEGSLAMTLANTVKSHVFTMKVRNYPSTLDAALETDEVDTSVYKMLVEQINNSLPTLHRYLRLRARMLGVSDLGYYDLYPSLVGEVKADYSWDKTKQLVLEAFAPLGPEYTTLLKEAVDNRWIDVYPATGKRSGAYVNGSAFDVHPYMLLNHQDDYESASTFAHESGHLMHSRLSSKNQPFETAFYETFVAEVTSTTNEWLFFKHMLGRAQDDNERLAILGSFLESVRTTVFRQTMFAEFELEMHRMAEKGQPITAASLDELYIGLLRKYHGEAEGVMKIDPLYAVEWAFIPHFHYNYYVYTYATSFIAGTAFVDQIRSGPEGCDRYINKLLKAGSSKPPVQILKDAGVDMTTPAPFQATVKAMNDVMDQIEMILDRK